MCGLFELLLKDDGIGWFGFDFGGRFVPVHGRGGSGVNYNYWTLLNKEMKNYYCGYVVFRIEKIHIIYSAKIKLKREFMSDSLRKKIRLIGYKVN